ncbi:Williams-Beuren syndrome chromosomal region 27 protein [Plakobranchus ocellatus]|uniref:Williams-Beuren syndrome chromosomal region 27 protein n=1 Tax=Plakobranchus ocellatus TaxID=259542 RepID=A0AAV4CC47_9GAST|nr:Williams-Beuren syndrome chromosomal region 27 protein [Plakobranchus ocellatus]
MLSPNHHQVHGKGRQIYRSTEMFAEVMRGLFHDPSSVRILDAGAGTGLTGEMLQSLGYWNVDALEPVEKFAETCRQRGFYQRILNQPVGMDKPVDVPDDTYDAVCVVGAFGPGAIPTSAIPEFVRIVKPGGYILNCMREEYLRTVDNFRDKLVPLLQEMEKEGRIQQLEWTIYPGHFNDKDGLRMLYRVL